MRFKGRALYNLLAITYFDDKSVQIEPWQIVDYRNMADDRIYQRLKELGTALTPDAFLLYSEDCETPEDLAECVTEEEENVRLQEEVYLLLFELWRRHLPRKKSLSIFGDELDHRLFLYDRGMLNDEELLHQSLIELEDVLDESLDLGLASKEIFQSVSQYCAHDLETFLYDYMVEQIKEHNETYASELLDGFYEYMSDPKWFDFLRARLFVASGSEEGEVLLSQLLEELEENPDIDLLFDVAQFLVHQGDKALFKKCTELLLAHIELEDDFQNLLSIISEFYRCLDQEAIELSLKAQLKQREHYNKESAVQEKDKKGLFSFLENA